MSATKKTTVSKKTKKDKPAHLEEVEDYWTKRSENFSESIESQIADGSYVYWLNQIGSELEPGKKLKVLDCGCGPGFFSIILGREGHHITAVDYSDGMVRMANKNFKKYGIFAKAQKMDAHDLEFEDNTFDLVVSRNIMWTLADPAKVYSEWMRILRPGGKIVTFDGNYKLHANDKDYEEVWKEQSKEMEKHSHKPLGPSEEDFQRMERITNDDFIVAHHRRPLWDMEILIELGAINVKSDVEGIHGASIVKNGKRKYLPMMFKVTATKGNPDLKNEDGHFWQ